jgi:hypothetical protein
LPPAGAVAAEVVEGTTGARLKSLSTLRLVAQVCLISRLGYL